MNVKWNAVKDFLSLNRISNDRFRIIQETLTRIGVDDDRDDGDKITLIPLCYIIQIFRRFYLVHYKQILGVEMTSKDYAQRNTVGQLLNMWKFVKVKAEELSEYGCVPRLTVLTHTQKKDGEWIIDEKVTGTQIGEFIKKIKENILQDGEKNDVK